LTLDPNLLGDTLYLPVPNNSTVALNRENGEVRWQLREPLKAVTQVQDTGELLLHGAQKLTLVRMDSGVVLSEARTNTLQDVVAGPDSSLLLVTPGGQLQRLNAAP
jgi:hypothetical protein